MAKHHCSYSNVLLRGAECYNIVHDIFHAMAALSRLKYTTHIASG